MKVIPKTKKYRDLNGNELNKYASIYANIDELHKQLFTGKEIIVLHILENSQESNRVRSYFSIVKGLAALLEQDPSTGFL